jgi:hypothetical protein
VRDVRPIEHHLCEEDVQRVGEATCRGGVAIESGAYERAYQAALRSLLLGGLPPTVQGVVREAPLRVIDHASRLWEDGRKGDLSAYLDALSRRRRLRFPLVHGGRTFAWLLGVARWTWNPVGRAGFACLAGICARALEDALGVRNTTAELVIVAIVSFGYRRI